MSYHVRRKDKEITDESVMKKILKTTKYVTLALSKDDVPYVVTLSHGYDQEGHCIYFHSASEGKKLDYMRANNLVWGQALLDHGYVEVECSHNYATVVFSGRITFLESLDDKWHAMSLMTRQLDVNAETMIADRKPESLENTVVGRIDIEYMSGKKSQEVDV